MGKTISSAAFGRLCVETQCRLDNCAIWESAAFGRLCVETQIRTHANDESSSAAFGRLCVETALDTFCANISLISRLRAAVC